jgi:hypothetical protein
MTRKEFMSLRLSEGIEYIEIRKKRENDDLNNKMMLAGQVCATIANFSQMRKKSKKYKIKDFFNIKINGKPKYESNESQILMLMTLTRQMGGEVNIGK